MAKIIIDGKQIECRDGINVLQAALEAGWDIPHYCYHPALSVVASCRLCLMEMKMPHPKTKEMEWAPKLVPSCQTPVRDGMEVRFNSEAVKDNQERTLEYYLVNHPLDCPVCDKAGECYLQDYNYQFGKARSRVVDPKLKNPKKDIGPRTLLYQDRCVMCSRCVRFAKEIAGTSELCIVNRGNRAEIDVFPGTPLANPLQGNVVDLCPVGALLDKDFLFKQRVWFLRGHDSICRGCSTGCAIRVCENESTVYRLRPRYNPDVNEWWICDEGRFGWKFVHDERRMKRPRLRRGTQMESPAWASIPETVRHRIEQVVGKHGGGAVAVQLSPEMSCEEAWLLATFVRSIAPQAALTLGDVQVIGEDQLFPTATSIGAGAEESATGGLPASVGSSDQHSAESGTPPSAVPAKEQGERTPVGSLPVLDGVKFVIHAEKNPNRRGIEALLAGLGGNVVSREDLLARAGKGEYKALWIVGGYPQAGWPSKELVAAAGKAELLIVQDMFENGLTSAAHLVLPFCAWVEREGTFVNFQGRLQPFERAINPPEGAVSDGQYLWTLAGHPGLFRAEKVRAMMAERLPQFAAVHVPPPVPEHQH
jgi:NADH-quinone oxidoreductase subunit G